LITAKPSPLEFEITRIPPSAVPGAASVVPGEGVTAGSVGLLAAGDPTAAVGEPATDGDPVLGSAVVTVFVGGGVTVAPPQPASVAAARVPRADAARDHPAALPDRLKIRTFALPRLRAALHPSGRSRAACQHSVLLFAHAMYITAFAQAGFVRTRGEPSG
jgi:hypothetical protein